MTLDEYCEATAESYQAWLDKIGTRFPPACDAWDAAVRSERERILSLLRTEGYIAEEYFAKCEAAIRGGGEL